MVEHETDQRDMHVIRTGQAKAAELRAPSNVTSHQAREGGKEPKAGVGRAFATRKGQSKGPGVETQSRMRQAGR